MTKPAIWSQTQGGYIAPQEVCEDFIVSHIACGNRSAKYLRTVPVPDGFSVIDLSGKTGLVANADGHIWITRGDMWRY